MSDTLFQNDTPPPSSHDDGPFVRVAIDRGFELGANAADGLTYRGDGLEIGDHVEAPLGRGNRTVRGVVTLVGGPEILDGLAPSRVKPVTRRIGSALPAELVRLGTWMSAYYLCPLGVTLASMVPAAVKAGTGSRTTTALRPTPALGTIDAGSMTPTVRTALENIRGLSPGSFPIEAKALASLVGARNAAPINTLARLGALEAVELTSVRAKDALWDQDGPLEHVPPRPALTEAQRHTIDGVAADLDGFKAHLLYGVTGSGKTEVYLRLIERVLDSGAGAIVLVPEIALTPQTAGRFVARFADRGVAVLHSGLSASARHKQWAAAASGEARMVVGARSAVFAPVQNLGLIVVDEEHDTSYKQDRAPRYHARDVAIKRAQGLGVPVVLGSATPSLESWNNAQTGRSTLWSLPERVGGGTMPSVKIVDLGAERRARRAQTGRDPGALEAIGPTLELALGETLDQGGQAILLLNRRGYTSYLTCPDPSCGWKLGCDSCDATMVTHRADASRRYLRCHHCLAQRLRPKACPLCGKPPVSLGAGTQRVEEEIESRFGTTHGLLLGETFERVDSDTMRSAADYFRTLQRFGEGKLKLLLGTQMIAKGLDYPNVRLVGVLNADTALSIPDFRAGERTFQLVSQVAGRAGRGVEPGRVIVQTFSPEEPALADAAAHDFRGFAQRELAERARWKLPPSTRLARVIVRDRDHRRGEQTASSIAAAVRASGEPVRVEGPAPCVLARIKDEHRVAIELTAGSASAIQRALGHARRTLDLASDSSVAVDVDPVNLL